MIYREVKAKDRLPLNDNYFPIKDDNYASGMWFFLKPEKMKQFCELHPEAVWLEKVEAPAGIKERVEQLFPVDEALQVQWDAQKNDLKMTLRDWNELLRANAIQLAQEHASQLQERVRELEEALSGMVLAWEIAEVVSKKATPYLKAKQLIKQ